MLYELSQANTTQNVVSRILLLLQEIKHYIKNNFNHINNNYYEVATLYYKLIIFKYYIEQIYKYSEFTLEQVKIIHSIYTELLNFDIIYSYNDLLSVIDNYYELIIKEFKYLDLKNTKLNLNDESLDQANIIGEIKACIALIQISYLNNLIILKPWSNSNKLITWIEDFAKCFPVAIRKECELILSNQIIQEQSQKDIKIQQYMLIIYNYIKCFYSIMYHTKYGTTTNEIYEKILININNNTNNKLIELGIQTIIEQPNTLQTKQLNSLCFKKNNTIPTITDNKK